ncbi:MAG: TIGR00374 family protein, partial [Solirubrobacteraceae bacterium]
MVFFGLIVALLFAVPGLRSTARLVERANLLWVAAAVGLELLSCASYAALFEHVFARLRRRFASRLSLSELAMNSVVSAGG